MSQYTNTNELFLEPKTNQYGSHMVMTNVSKSNKTKYVNIDTRFRDEYNYQSTVNYNITLPQRITDVKSLTVNAVELPMSFFNISASLGNNYFLLTHTDNSDIYHVKYTNMMITIPDGYYSINSIQVAINNAINTTLVANFPTVQLYHDNNSNPPVYPTYFQINNSISSFYVTYKNGNRITLLFNNFTIRFDVNLKGEPDKNNFKSKLGWILGFRNTSYTIYVTSRPADNLINDYNMYNALSSESIVDLTGPRYLYLAIDEYNKGNQYSFVSPLYNSIINKNIIARISLSTPSYVMQPFNSISGSISTNTQSGSINFNYNENGFRNSILCANLFNGLLVSDQRSYTGKIDFLKLNVQLLDEYGNLVNLNGLDFSFCLCLEHE